MPEFLTESQEQDQEEPISEVEEPTIELVDDDDGDEIEVPSHSVSFTNLELEEIEPEVVDEFEGGDYEAPSDEELAEILEMNSESSVIEFASELVLEEDSVMEFDEDSLKVDEDGKVAEEEIEAQSFSIIHNSEMRAIFAQEAMNKLKKIDELLEKSPLKVQEDDELSISLHTLLGNARTLGLEDLADAYNSAEHMCCSR